MFVHSLDPVAFALGPFTIYWYGLVYVLGFLAAYIIFRKYLGLSAEKADSLLLWMGAGLVLGARTFFFAFYRPDLFLTFDTIAGVSVPQFFALWNGGMSFHGGLVGLGLAGWWWSRRHDVDLWRIADAAALTAAPFLVLGRIANFVNGEIYGTPSDASWCVVFPDVEGCRHPAQLYAAAKDVLISALIWPIALFRAHRPGFVFWLFAALYGVLRFVVNVWRDDPVIAFGWLKMGQLLSLALLAVAAMMLWRRHREDLQNLFKGSS